MAIWDERHSLWIHPISTDPPVATWTVVAGSVAAAYPLANVYDERSHTITRSLGGTLGIKATFATPQLVAGVAVINHNATAITVANNAGLAATPLFSGGYQSPYDGLAVDPWLDLRSQAPVCTASQWTFSFTGSAAGIAVGEILFAQELWVLDFLIGTVRRREAHPVVRHQTDGGVSWRYDRGFRSRGVAGIVNKKSLETTVIQGSRWTHGGLHPSLLVLDSKDAVYNPFGPDALYVELINDLEMQWGHPAITVVQLEFQELGKGARL
jgi:hypothetical protein